MARSKRTAATRAGTTGRAASGWGPAPRGDRFYQEWFGFVVDLLKWETSRIRATTNFQRGQELEVALCYALARILPQRFGLCRGYIVDKKGDQAGDDLIVYDAARFPTQRSLGGSFDRHEYVPAEAVLAYIEVKHTLYARARVRKSNIGQSIKTACQQIAKIKRLERDAVPLARIAPRLMLDDDLEIPPRRGFPAIRNPWYAAVWALNLCVDPELRDAPAEAVSKRVDEIAKETPRAQLPDIIAADSVLVTPALAEPGDNHRLLQPFITPETKLACAGGLKALGLAVFHLLWAIEDIVLDEIPWVEMLRYQLTTAEQGHESRAILLNLRPDADKRPAR